MAASSKLCFVLFALLSNDRGAIVRAAKVKDKSSSHNPDTNNPDQALGTVVGWKGGRTDLGTVEATEDMPVVLKFDEVLDDPELEPIDFRAGGGLVYGNHLPFSIKGINWYGSESRNGPPGGLDKHSISWYMEFLARNDFNAIRLLFNQ